MSRRTLPPYYAATNAELEAAVRWAIEEGEPVDTVTSRLLYPGGPPQLWGDWAAGAQERYFQALALYTTLRTQPRAIHVQAADAWRAIQESDREPPQRRFSWDDLAERLRVPVRTAQYQVLNVLGFVFAGRPGPARRLVAGPCLFCHQVREVAALVGALCEQCRNDGT